jgi:cytochrome P450
VVQVLRGNGVFANAGGFRPTGLHVPLKDRTLGELDPPEHGPIRRLALGAVNNAAVEGMRGFARDVSRRLLDGILAQGRGDLVGRFSVLLTNQVVAKMLGVPLDRGDWLAEQAEAVMFSELPVTNRTPRGEGYEGAFPEFAAFIDELIEQRLGLEDPGEDAVGRIIRSAGKNWAVTDRVARMVLMQLLLGGTATTRDFIGHLFLELIRRPDLHAAIRERPSLVPVAVEEGLRLAPPVLFVIRTCSQDTELRGVALKEGERVIAALAAANRDASVYETPDAFRLDRTAPAPHLTFGFGSHHCVGSALARMEVQTALEVFVERVEPGALRTVPGFQLRHMPTPFLYGPASLEVERA